MIDDQTYKSGFGNSFIFQDAYQPIQLPIDFWKRPTIKIKLTSETAKVPVKAHATDAGFDIFCDEDGKLSPGERKAISTGFASEIPVGWYAQVKPRSGLATKQGINLSTSGVIDSSYRGVWFVTLINHGDKEFIFRKGDKIAQFLILPVPNFDIEIVDELSDSDRGTNGFGSTGIL